MKTYFQLRPIERATGLIGHPVAKNVMGLCTAVRDAGLNFCKVTLDPPCTR